MDSRPPRQLGRSILAVFAGFLVVVVLSIVADFCVYAMRLAPAPGQRMSNNLLMVAFAYRTLFAILGSYVTARLAPYRPMLHCMVGGIIGFCLAGAGIAATWNSPQTQGAHWYPIAVAVVAFPCAWIGAKLYRERPVATTVA